MPDPTIRITGPTTGSTVGRPIPVSGTYTSDQPSVMINVALKDSSGATVAMVGAMGSGGGWGATLTPSQGYTNASIAADIAGTAASDSVGNITVT
jgi:hypothetical protein